MASLLSEPLLGQVSVRPVVLDCGYPLLSAPASRRYGLNLEAELLTSLVDERVCSAVCHERVRDVDIDDDDVDVFV